MVINMRHKISMKAISPVRPRHSESPISSSHHKLDHIHERKKSTANNNSLSKGAIVVNSKKQTLTFKTKRQSKLEHAMAVRKRKPVEYYPPSHYGRYQGAFCRSLKNKKTDNDQQFASSADSISDSAMPVEQQPTPEPHSQPVKSNTLRRFIETYLPSIFGNIQPTLPVKIAQNESLKHFRLQNNINRTIVGEPCCSKIITPKPSVYEIENRHQNCTKKVDQPQPENISDAAFEKRHQKKYSEERKMIRLDIRRQREEEMRLRLLKRYGNDEERERLKKGNKLNDGERVRRLSKIQMVHYSKFSLPKDVKTVNDQIDKVISDAEEWKSLSDIEE